MTTLTLKNISKEYTPGEPILADINLTAPDGELLALLGPSGGGKTTILRLIAGLLQPTAGDILFDGESVLDVPAEKRGAAMVFQVHGIFPFMTVGENVAFGLKLKKLDHAEIETKVAKALSAVQLDGFHDRRSSQLSGGQRQRVALARALVIRPNILLLDEPLNDLEAALRADLRTMIRNLQKEYGITTIFVTHDQTEAITVADRIALLLDGKLRQIGPPRSFFDQPTDVDVVRFFGGGNIIKGNKQGALVHTEIGPLEITRTEWPDGDVLLTIRPEAIELGPDGYNTREARVLTYDFRGNSAHCKIQIGNKRLQVSTQPHHAYQEGASITLHLPKERIHLLPKKEAQ